jgi:hypothetical protein
MTHSIQQTPKNFPKSPLQPQPKIPAITPTPKPTHLQLTMTARQDAAPTPPAHASSSCRAPRLPQPSSLPVLPLRPASAEIHSQCSQAIQAQQENVYHRRANPPLTPFHTTSAVQPHAPQPQPLSTSSPAAPQHPSPQVPTLPASTQRPPSPPLSATQPQLTSAELQSQAEAHSRRFLTKLRRYLSRQRNGRAIYALVHGTFVACSEQSISVFKLQTTLRGALREHPKVLRALGRVLRHIHYALNLVRPWQCASVLFVGNVDGDESAARFECLHEHIFGTYYHEQWQTK